MDSFRVCLKTKDGSLIQNRESDPKFWFHMDRNRLIENEDFVRISLATDCREKGVRLISYIIDTNGVNAIVDYL